MAAPCSIPRGWDRHYERLGSAPCGGGADFAGPALGWFQVLPLHKSAGPVVPSLGQGVSRSPTRCEDAAPKCTVAVSRRQTQQEQAMSIAGFATPITQHKLAALRGNISQAEKDAFVQRKIAWHERVLEASKVVRPLVRNSQPVLFHGTRYANQILRENRLLSVDVGTLSVHFTRELPVATHWALLPRIEGDEGVGAVLVFDRDRLAHDYSLKCFRDSILDNGTYPPYHNEADEIIHRRDVVGLHKYLIDVIWIDEKSQRVRSAKQVREERAPTSIGSGGSGLPRPGSRLLSAGQQKSAATQRLPGASAVATLADLGFNQCRGKVCNYKCPDRVSRPGKSRFSSRCVY